MQTIQVDIWTPVPVLSANANSTVPAAPCQRCQCQMSIYREPWESWCWPCQDAEPDGMPMPERGRRGDAAGIILGQLLAGAATAREIRDGTGLPAPTVKDRLQVLVRAGSVAKTPGHVPRYYLTAADAAA